MAYSCSSLAARSMRVAVVDRVEGPAEHAEFHFMFPAIFTGFRQMEGSSTSSATPGKTGRVAASRTMPSRMTKLLRKETYPAARRFFVLGLGFRAGEGLPLRKFRRADGRFNESGGRR